MFDFSKMDQAFAAMGELDGLLRSIRDEQRTTNMLLAMLVSHTDASRWIGTDLQSLITSAHAIANDPDSRT